MLAANTVETVTNVIAFVNNGGARSVYFTIFLKKPVGPEFAINKKMVLNKRCSSCYSLQPCQLSACSEKIMYS